MRKLISVFVLIALLVATSGCATLLKYGANVVTVKIKGNPVKLSELLDISAGLASEVPEENEAALAKLTEIVGVDCNALVNDIEDDVEQVKAAIELAKSIVEQIKALFDMEARGDPVLKEYEINIVIE